MDHDSRTTAHRSRPNKGSSKGGSLGTRTRPNSLGEQLPGYLPKGRVSPKSYVPPKSSTTTSGQAACLSGSQKGSESPRTVPLRQKRNSPDCPECSGNKGPASHRQHKPPPRHSPSKLPTASPDLSPALTEAPCLLGGTSSPHVLAPSGRGTPESRGSSSRKRGESGRVSWQQEHPQAEASAKRRASRPSLYRWLVSHLPSRVGRERVAQDHGGPEGEAVTLDRTCRTSEICSPRAFWKGTSSVSGQEGPVGARSTLRGDLCTAVLAVVIVVLVTTLIWVLYTGNGEKTSAAATAQGCVTDTCVKYEKLLSLTMDTSAPPCEDFYQYVCGTWLRTGNRPIYERNWDMFLNNVGRRVMASGDSAGDVRSTGNDQVAEGGVQGIDQHPRLYVPVEARQRRRGEGGVGGRRSPMARSQRST
ncbi:hypothetical protein MRX96_016409 [Rhipicephalus microplus]